MNFLNFIKNLCAPAIIYLILGLIGTASSKNDTVGKIISVIVVLLITYFLDYVCKTYGKTTSWYILIALYLLPFILAIIMFSIIFLMNRKGNNTSFFKSLKITEKFSPSKLTSKLSKTISSKI